MKDSRDYSVSFIVSNLTASQADKLDTAFKRAKRKYASEGRGVSFFGKTCDVGNHISFTDRKRLEK